MQDNEKYFTPDIEDIHIGYECELLMPDIQWHKVKVGLDNKTMNPDEEWWVFRTDKSIRVPYLTKEQIEAEGWISKQLGMGWIPLFTKGNFMLGFREDMHFISIQPLDPSRWEFIDSVDMWYLYQGECKDINTFRWICKLLKI